MQVLARVVDVEVLDGYKLKLTFSDGLIRELDFSRTVELGVLAALAQPNVFETVTIDEVAGTIAWPNGIDFDPDVLYGAHASDVAFAPRLVREYRLRSTAQRAR